MSDWKGETRGAEANKITRDVSARPTGESKKFEQGHTRSEPAAVDAPEGAMS